MIGFPSAAAESQKPMHVDVCTGWSEIESGPGGVRPRFLGEGDPYGFRFDRLEAVRCFAHESANGMEVQFCQPLTTGPKLGLAFGVSS